MKRKLVDNFTLAQWRAMDAILVLSTLAEYAKLDTTYIPKANGHSTRWFAKVAGVDIEVLCTGPKFFNTRTKRGGGGAVDMAMHFFSLNFEGAVRLLREKGI